MFFFVNEHYLRILDRIFNLKKKKERKQKTEVDEVTLIKLFNVSHTQSILNAIFKM